MQKIFLHRPKESFNKHSAYRILLGKQVLTELNNGEEKMIEVPQELNSKELKAKINWCGSQPMKVRQIEVNGKVIIRGNKFLNKIMPLSGAILPLIGLLIVHLNLVSKTVGMGIIILVLIGLVGTVTIWRNHWLHMEME